MTGNVNEVLVGVNRKRLVEEVLDSRGHVSLLGPLEGVAQPLSVAEIKLVEALECGVASDDIVLNPVCVVAAVVVLFALVFSKFLRPVSACLRTPWMGVGLWETHILKGDVLDKTRQSVEGYVARECRPAQRANVDLLRLPDI